MQNSYNCPIPSLLPRCNSRLHSAVRRPHPPQRPVLVATSSVRLLDLRFCCMVLSYVMRGVLEVSSSPLEGELTGSSWHLHYRLYAQCTQKGSGDIDPSHNGKNSVSKIPVSWSSSDLAPKSNVYFGYWDTASLKIFCKSLLTISWDINQENS